MKTPMELWSGDKPECDHLRVVGSLAYSHISQDKLDPRAEKCIMLGYPEWVKGYKLWRIGGGKPRVFVSRNVEFQETVFYKNVVSEHCDKFPNPDEGVQSQSSNGNHNMIERRPKRNIIKTLRYRDNSNLSAVAFSAAEEESIYEPMSYDEAMTAPNQEKWYGAMREEMTSLWKNKTWELVKDPISGSDKPRFKARLVAKGFTQKTGVDYTKIFSPAVKHTTIRVILSITAALDLVLEQLDVTTAFLHGYLDEKIYMQQPTGFVEKGKEDQVCLLKRSLYGLKQSPRQWYKRFDQYVVSNGFIKSSYDSCLYFRRCKKGNYMYLLLYVDDMLIACQDKGEIEATKSMLKREFEMKELGEAKKILGMQITRNRELKQLKLCQTDYAKKVLKNYAMEDCKPVKAPFAAHFKLSAEDSPKTDEEAVFMTHVPYANYVWSLMYLMVCTRPDLAYGVSVVSRYLSNPGKAHWEGVKWILRYLKGTADHGLVFGKDVIHGSVQIEGYVDADFAKDLDKCRSITSFVFKCLGSVISWKSHLQSVIALSTTEAEYMSLCEAVKEALWLSRMVRELGMKVITPIVHCDNQGALQLAKNSVFHERTKHIRVKWLFIREEVNHKRIQVIKIDTQQNMADVLTKSLPGVKFDFCKSRMGVA
ncbi:hypothetical protein QVD17_34841 [Tagetes erecta]|uniref:Reverse transcriptase Ty1/copia-type domain-containing protein n=1 Tax=Tagetes erecta TaxID=13708 RepID=A0AAD8JYB1_TARER|nr:hypothetical protein QVD17_34841 [Tagetes erecta]